MSDRAHRLILYAERLQVLSVRVSRRRDPAGLAEAVRLTRRAAGILTYAAGLVGQDPARAEHPTEGATACLTNG